MPSELIATGNAGTTFDGGEIRRQWYLTVAIGALCYVSTLSALADSSRKPIYRTKEGMGYTVCEAYLRNLRAFGPSERDPVCDPRPHPGNKDFSEPTWHQVDVQQHLQLIYQAEMSWGIYLFHPERHPS